MNRAIHEYTAEIWIERIYGVLIPAVRVKLMYIWIECREFLWFNWNDSFKYLRQTMKTVRLRSLSKRFYKFNICANALTYRNYKVKERKNARNLYSKWFYWNRISLNEFNICQLEFVFFIFVDLIGNCENFRSLFRFYTISW